MVYNAYICHQLCDESLTISHRAADMSPLIQYAVVSMISGSVVALISMVAILGILTYQSGKGLNGVGGTIKNQVRRRLNFQYLVWTNQNGWLRSNHLALEGP
jgi:hypothetical protein